MDKWWECALCEYTCGDLRLAAAHWQQVYDAHACCYGYV